MLLLWLLLKDADEFKKFVNKYNDIVKLENAVVEPGLVVSITKCRLPKFMIDKDTQKNLILALYGVPHGVLKYRLIYQS